MTVLHVKNKGLKKASGYEAINAWLPIQNFPNICINTTNVHMREH